MRVFPFALVCLMPASVQAQELTEEARAEARAHFEAGSLAFERGDYADAAREFQASHALTRHPDLLYNIYTAQERNGQLVEAREALAGYLRDGSPDEPRREALQLRLARLDERIAQARAEEQAAAEERRASAAQLEREEEQRRQAESRAAAERASRVESQRGAHASSDALVIAGVSALIAAGLGGVAFGVLAGLSEAEDARLEEECTTNVRPLCRPSDVAKLQRLNLAADALWIASAGVAIAGLALIAIGEGIRPGAPEPAQAWLVPVISPRGFGAYARGRW